MSGLLCAALAGCDGGEAATDGPTWHQDVAPLAQERCGTCHTAGGIAPFSIDTYAEAQAWAGPMAEAVASGRMPPWGAVVSDECTPPAPYKNDPTLSAAEIALFADWAEAGAPEGDASSAAPLPEVEVPRLEDADMVLPLQEPFVVDGSEDIYRCFVVDPKTTEDLYITGVQVVPDNDKVVHHVLVWTDPYGLSDAMAGPDGSYPCDGTPGIWPTGLMAVWVPGAPPMIPPENSAIRFDAHAKIVVNVHYYPTGTSEEVDQTSVAVRFTDKKPVNWAEWYLIDLPFGAEPVESEEGESKFEIPAGEAEHWESVSLYLPKEDIPIDLPIWAVSPHMHLLGQELKVTVEKEDGSEVCLVHSPSYDFNWQLLYEFDAPQSQLPTLRGGDRVRVDCRYNNSTSNDALMSHLARSGLEEPYTVGWGENTGSEMCMSITGFMVPSFIDLY